jgi:hypothetical protein
VSNTLLKVEYVKKSTGLSYRRISEISGLGYRSLMRWRMREVRSESVINLPGPFKTEPFDPSVLRGEIKGLTHCRKRTHGISALYGRWSSLVSRRDIAMMAADIRRELYLAQRSEMLRVNCIVPGLIWAMDVTEYGRSLEGNILQVLNTSDLGSRNIFEPLCASWMPCGEEVGGHIAHLFTRYGPPLFFKEDNAKNLTSSSVTEVMAENFVIPLTSPCYYPQYNGALENANGLLKKEIRREMYPFETCPEEYFHLYVKAAANNLNHVPRAILKGQIPCRVFYDRPKWKKYSIPERRNIYDWINETTESILSGMDNPNQTARNAARRRAILKWLQLNNIVTLERNHESVTLLF